MPDSFGRVILVCTAAAILPAQTFKTLATFNGGTDGSLTYYETLAQGTDGNFYGTTERGGSSLNCTYGCGTIFRITPHGKLTTLYNFSNTDGANPYAGLVLGTNREFYGTTYGGGANGYGTIFKVSQAGTLTTLHSFDSADGANPYAALVQAANGQLYGATLNGGPYPGYGTIFKMTPGGTFTSLFSFDLSDGYSPYGTLMQASNGDLYGTAEAGGINFNGTVFRMTPGGSLSTLHSFSAASTDGAYPKGALVQAANGDLYGTTWGGGANNVGTIFKITPDGTLTTLYAFCPQTGCNDGEHPMAGLVQATDGNFYGTTNQGGPSGDGTIFEFTAAGTERVLHSFDATDGYYPYGGLLQATDGNFYGTTWSGGPAGGAGTVFRLSMGLGPFVKTLPASGAAGATVIILGNELTGATGVTFNGTAATFSVNSPGTAITTTVPDGASTGSVQVTTASGTLSSNIQFRVTN